MSESLKQRQTYRWIAPLPALIILLGITLRTAEYLHNKAIWLDEAQLVVSILQRGYLELLNPLEYKQTAPYAFLVAERRAVDLFGPGEYALRFVPWLASTLALPLLWLFLKRFLRFDGAVVALALFALAPGVIRYASEVKPYALDVVVTILLLVLAKRSLSASNSGTWLLALAIAGAVAVWCSIPAIFVLAGIGATLAIAAALDRRGGRFAATVAVGILWLLSFATYYQTVIRYTGDDAILRSWWTDSFMPLPPRSLTDLNGFVRTFFDLFRDPIGAPAIGIGALLFLLGVLSLLFRDRRALLLLLAPIAFALLASGLQRYPFTGRFLLFATPLVLVLTGEGFQVLRARSRTALIPALIAIILFTQPAIAGVRTLVRSDVPQGVRPAYAHLMENYQQGDTVYVYHWTIVPLRYCMLRDGVEIPFAAGITARADWQYYIRDMESLFGNERVWLVFINTPRPLVGEEEKFFTTWLDAHGERLDTLRAPESSVYLYDLSAAKTSS
ncbi:MAG: glycosyltransferase family 39 protein [Candidatus Hydrogenedentes bacterium]|nr:glycosyltransferase family 39 protein [Candidatus Hydrogenedentota bacterium]